MGPHPLRNQGAAFRLRLLFSSTKKKQNINKATLRR